MCFGNWNMLSWCLRSMFCFAGSRQTLTSYHHHSTQSKLIRKFFGLVCLLRIVNTCIGCGVEAGAGQGAWPVPGVHCLCWSGGGGDTQWKHWPRQWRQWSWASHWSRQYKSLGIGHTATRTPDTHAQIITITLNTAATRQIMHTWHWRPSSYLPASSFAIVDY